MVQELVQHLTALHIQRLHQQLKHSLRLALHHHQQLPGIAPLHLVGPSQQPQTYLLLVSVQRQLPVQQAGIQALHLVNVIKKGTNE